MLINVLFVLIMVPPRKPRSQPPGTLSPAPIDQKNNQLEQDEPLSLRHVVASVAMGAFFVLVPPLLAALDALERFARSLTRKDGSERRE